MKKQTSLEKVEAKLAPEIDFVKDLNSKKVAILAALFVIFVSTITALFRVIDGGASSVKNLIDVVLILAGVIAGVANLNQLKKLMKGKRQ